MILPVASLIFYSIPIKSSLHSIPIKSRLHLLPMRSSLYFMPMRKSLHMKSLDILLGMNNLSEFPFDESLYVNKSLYVNELSLCNLRLVGAKGFCVSFLID
jgi:hypothetical protein